MLVSAMLTASPGPMPASRSAEATCGNTCNTICDKCLVMCPGMHRDIYLALQSQYYLQYLCYQLPVRDLTAPFNTDHCH